MNLIKDSKGKADHLGDFRTCNGSPEGVWFLGVKVQRELMVSQSGDMVLRGSAWIIRHFGFY